MPDDITTRDLATHDARTSGDLSTAADPAPDREPFPDRVGRYEIVGEIAHGGMGVVYRARDPDLNREVAVKLIRHAFRQFPAAVRRFTDEATITGQLQHPGIPPVFEVGELDDGSPFLAMKLIRGQTLEAILASGEHQPTASAPQREIDSPHSPSLIAVFEHICQAVSYAHAHGVIHRDLKPANVMVGAFGEVQVMDWGLAKVLNSAAATRNDATDPAATLGTEIQSLRGEDAATQAGSLLGTPAFMPPEQAMGAIDEVDARSDVFGLGAVLCAILTGRPPYVGTDVEDTRKLAVRGKLDDALARLDACGAEPELVALCQRCLSPEKANRPADAGAVAAAVAALRAEADERARRAERDRAAAEAEAREQRKRQRVQLALAAAVALLAIGGGAFAWWADRQATARRTEAENRDRDERERLARNAEALAELVGRCETALREDDSDRAAAALDEIDRRLAEGGGAELAGPVDRCRADLAVLRDLDAIDTFGWTWRDNDFPSRDELAARRQATYARIGVMPGETRTEAAAARVGQSLVRNRLLAGLDVWLNEAPSRGLLELLRVIDPDPFRNAVREATVAQDRSRLAELMRRPEALDQPPGFAVAIGLNAHVHATRRLAALEGAIRARPWDFQVLMNLAKFSRLSQPKSADKWIRWLQAAVALRPQNGAAHLNLGLALFGLGDVDGAIASYRTTLRFDPDDAVAHNNLGNALALKGDLDQALVHSEQAVRLDPTAAPAQHNLGNVLRRKGNLAGALAAHQEAIRLKPTYALPYVGIGNVHREQGNLDKAVDSYRKALQLEPRYAGAHAGLGSVLRAKGQVDEAIACFRAAIEFDPSSAVTHYNLGNALTVKRDLDGAIRCYRTAIRLDPKYTPPRNNLGMLLRQMGDLRGAVGCYEDAIRVDPAYSRAHNGLAWLLAAGPDWLRDGRRAVELATRACELTDWKTASNLNTLAVAHAEAGDFAKAVEYQKRVLASRSLSKPLEAEARKQLGLFTRGRPYRDPELARRELAPRPRAVK